MHNSPFNLGIINNDSLVVDWVHQIQRNKRTETTFHLRMVLEKHMHFKEVIGKRMHLNAIDAIYIPECFIQVFLSIPLFIQPCVSQIETKILCR